MNPSFVIIHGSVIFRQGLACLLSKYTALPVHIFSEPEDLKNSALQLKGVPQLILADSYYSKQLIHYLSGIAHKNTRLLFLGEQQDQDFTCLSPETSEEKLKEHIKSFLDELNSDKNHIKDRLTQRELDVLQLLVLGHSSKEIAENLHISEHTAVSHRKNITRKTGIKSLSGLAVYAIINNLINTTSLNLDDLI